MNDIEPVGEIAEAGCVEHAWNPDRDPDHNDPDAEGPEHIQGWNEDGNHENNQRGGRQGRPPVELCSPGCQGNADDEEAHLAWKLARKLDQHAIVLRRPGLLQRDPPRLRRYVDDKKQDPSMTTRCPQKPGEQGQHQVEHDLDLERPERSINLGEPVVDKHARQVGLHKVQKGEIPPHITEHAHRVVSRRLAEDHRSQGAAQHHDDVGWQQAARPLFGIATQ